MTIEMGKYKDKDLSQQSEIMDLRQTNASIERVCIVTVFILENFE